jgi:hypothetical protein
MMCIPNILKAGNKIGTIKNAFSDVLKLIFGEEQAVFLFIRYATKINKIATILNEIKSGIVANGVSYPRASDRLFNTNPKNIKKEMLSPTDNTNFSVSLSLFSFNI